MYLILTAIVGDITPSDGVPKAKKSKLERAALNEMCQILGGGFRGTCELWLSSFPVLVKM